MTSLQGKVAVSRWFKHKIMTEIRDSCPENVLKIQWSEM